MKILSRETPMALKRLILNKKILGFEMRSPDTEDNLFRVFLGDDNGEHIFALNISYTVVASEIVPELSLQFGSEFPEKIDLFEGFDAIDTEVLKGHLGQRILNFEIYFEKSKVYNILIDSPYNGFRGRRDILIRSNDEKEFAETGEIGMYWTTLY